MRRFRFWPHMALVLAFAVTNGGCVLVPKLKDRVVELAVTGSTSEVFSVQGSDTAVDETTTPFDVGADLDLAKILDDNGIDVSKVKSVKINKVEYRIVRADPDPTRAVTNGIVTIKRGVAAAQNLVTAFSASPGAVSGFTNIPLDPAGVGVVNTLLEDIRAALPGAPANGLVTFHLTGNSTSTGGNPTDFDFELKITVTIVGTVSVSVPT
jgi:hypothetical protein